MSEFDFVLHTTCPDGHHVSMRRPFAIWRASLEASSIVNSGVTNVVFSGMRTRRTGKLSCVPSAPPRLRSKRCGGCVPDAELRPCSCSAFVRCARRVTAPLSNDAQLAVTFQETFLHASDVLHTLLAQLLQKVLFGDQF